MMCFSINIFVEIKKKSNVCYACGITPKRVTSGGAEIRG